MYEDFFSNYEKNNKKETKSKKRKVRIGKHILSGMLVIALCIASFIGGNIYMLHKMNDMYNARLEEYYNLMHIFDSPAQYSGNQRIGSTGGVDIIP